MFTIKDALNYYDIGKETSRKISAGYEPDLFEVFGKNLKRFEYSIYAINLPNHETEYYQIAFSNLWVRGITKGLQAQKLPNDDNDVRTAMIEYLPVINGFMEQIKSAKENEKIGLELPEEFKDDKTAQSLLSSFTQKPYALDVLKQTIETKEKTKSAPTKEIGSFGL